ncbi:MAG TPA: hypothetical protein IAD08_06005 [Candidatus Scatovivens faecipullorum]|nr:hypothetical protein [Candidatus Scatovivens faecipullorum]
MDDEKILDVLNKYIENPKMQYAILIDGDWGSGKTYFIKTKFVKNNKNIIYIPLNGIKNREDIDKKIYYKILENNMPEKITKSKGFSAFKKTSGAIFVISNEIIKNVFKIDISGVKNLNASEIISLFKNISDYVIVFDDLERCEMPISETLGYINDYVEHKNVKCVIVANEQEINKINYDNNYELKVMSCLNDNIDYGEKQGKDIFTKINNEENKKVDIPKIKNRILNMYDGNKKYKAIKEKLIGITIKYIPDINKVYDQLIVEYKKKNKDLYEFLKENKNKCINIIKLNNCNNIRTMIFILDRFEILYNEINRLNIDKKYSIINLVFINVIFSSIGIKKGIDIKQILSGVMYSSAACLTEDVRQNNNNYYTAFNFVDDFILDGNIDRSKMLGSIQYYLDINYENIEDDDPYNKLKVYWELEDDEIKNAMQEILVNIKANKYNYKLFPKIIYSLSCIENLNFEKEIIQEIITEMGKYIENNEIDYIDFHVFTRDEQVTKIYNKNIKYIKDKMAFSSKNKNIINLKDIFESKDWGVKLNEYIREQDCIEKKQFLNEFDIDTIVEKIKNSNSKNIYNFKYCIDRIYNFSNLKDFYINDLEKMEQLIEKLKDIDKDSFGITKKEAIEYLIKTLKEKIKLLEQ